jgi:hypothetical protein
MSLIQKVFAQDNIFGQLNNPLGSSYGSVTYGFTNFVSNILRLFFVVAGILALFNFIIAGFTYMQAAGDPKQLAQAWSRIWQTFLGLILLVSSFLLISLISFLIFHDASFILNPKIYGPGAVPATSGF